jgi:Leucine-rich repeat (LRR) protein
MLPKVIVLILLINECFGKSLNDDGIHLNNTILKMLGYNSSTTTIYAPFADIVSIDPDTFYDFINLEVLILSFSRIKVLEPRTFSNLKKLAYLDLHYNQIEVIDEYIFKELKSLELLFLESNQISDFNKNALVNLKNLTQVCLCENPISINSPTSLDDICRTNPNCVLNISNCCFNSK